MNFVKNRFTSDALHTFVELHLVRQLDSACLLANSAKIAATGVKRQSSARRKRNEIYQHDLLFIIDEKRANESNFH